MSQEGKPLQRVTAGALLGGLLVLLLLGNLYWFHDGARPQHWDSAIHLAESLNANRLSEMPGDSTWERLLSVSWYYPPFVSYAAVPVYRLLGENEAAGLLVMTLFCLLFIACAGGIAWRLFGGGEALLTALLLAACPIVVELSRTFMLDLPLAAMVALAVLLLVASDGLSRWLPCVACGVVLGCGMLTKWTFAAFVVPALLAALVLQRKTTPAGRVLRLGVALALAFFVCAPWYVQHALQIATSRTHVLGTSQHDLLQASLYYLRAFPGQMSWPLAAFCLTGIILFWRQRLPHRAFLALWFCGSYVLVSLIGFREPRFSVALLLPVTITASAGLLAWTRQGASATSKRRLVLAACVVLAFSTLLLSGLVPASSSWGRTLARGAAGMPLLACHGADPADWGNAALVGAMLESPWTGPTPAACRVLPDLPYLNDATLRLQARLRRAPITVSGTSNFPLFTDYVVVKDGEQGIDPQATRATLSQQVLAEARGPHSMYTVVRRIALPDTSTVWLLRVAPQPRDPAPLQRVQHEVGLQADAFLSHYLRDARGVDVRVRVASEDAARRGRIARIAVHAERALVGDFQFQNDGIVVHDLAFELRDLQLDVGELLERHHLRLFGIGGVTVSGLSIEAGDVLRYLSATARDVRVDSLSIENGRIAVQANLPGAPSLRLRLALTLRSGNELRFHVERARFGRMPLPAALLNRLTAAFNPLITPDNTPLALDLGCLQLQDGRLRLTARPVDGCLP